MFYISKSQSDEMKVRSDMRCSVLVGDLQRYAYWMGPRSKWVMDATGLLGWRLSRIVRGKMGRPTGALSWPLGLGLLGLNSRVVEISLNEISVINQVLDGFERRAEVHVDWCGVLYAALQLYETFDDAGGIARVERLASTLVNRPGASDGEISYAANRDDVLVDTIGMICPMLARLSRLTGTDRYRNIGLLHLERFLEKSIDEATGWPWHGYRRESGEKLGLPGWGRGLGWLLLGLVDTTLELSRKDDFAKWFGVSRVWIERMHECQLFDGNWSWLLTDGGSNFDTSVTAMLGYSACRFYSHDPSQSGIARSMFERAFLALDEMTDDAGRVQGSSGEAGGWGDYSRQFGNNLWVQGPAVALQRLREDISL